MSPRLGWGQKSRVWVLAHPNVNLTGTGRFGAYGGNGFAAWYSQAINIQLSHEIGLMPGLAWESAGGV